KILYKKNEFSMLWSDNDKWKPIADSLYDLIAHAEWYGLFREDYHEKDVSLIRELFSRDSMNNGDRRDPFLWSRADILLTDAFLQLIRDVKLGRLPNDSISLNKDTALSNEFFEQQF